MEILNITKWEVLDTKQKELGKQLKELLEKKYDKVEMVYSSLGCETDIRGLTVHMYSNEYDYKEISLKYPTEASVKEYYNAVVVCMDTKEWTREHNASPEEIYITELLKKHRCEDLYIRYNELSSNNVDSETTVYIDDICELKYYASDGKLVVRESGEEDEVIVDLVNGIIKYNKPSLEQCLKTISNNSNKFDWFIRDDKVLDFDRNNKNSVILCELKEIKDYDFTEDVDSKTKSENEMWIGLINGETIYLDTATGSSM